MLAKCLAMLFVVISGAVVLLSKPDFASAQDSTQQVKVMTFNIKDGVYNNVNHRQKAQKIAEYVATSKIEIIGLQEVANGSASSMPNVVAMLVEELTARNYPMEYRQVNIGTHGNAIFSKFPIKDYQVIDMTINSPRKAQQITVQIAGKNIVFINTHLNSQGPCLAKLLGYITSLPTNEVVFLGDINEVLNYDYSCDSTNQNIDKISDYYLTCRNETGAQLCIRSIVGNTNKIIDYIAVKKKSSVRIVDATTFATNDPIPISDHFAVLATLSVAGGASPTIRGDFNNDGKVTLVDLHAFLPIMHTTNSFFSLIGTDNFVDLFDYNELLKLLAGTPASPTPTPTPTPSPSSPVTTGKSTVLACDLTKPQPNPNKMLNVGTWNIGGQKDDATKALAFKLAGEKFKEFDLDIMILQEVHKYRTTPFSDPVTRTDLPKIIQSTMPNVPLYFYATIQDGTHSVVTVSKFPITESAFKGIAGSRAVTYALINSPVGKVKVFNTHLQRQDIQTCPGLTQITQFTAQHVSPADTYIIGGDFNLELRNGIFYQIEATGPRGCESQTSPFFGYYARQCAGKPCDYSGVIDYIFGNGETVNQYCLKPNWGVIEAHNMFVGTITVK